MGLEPVTNSTGVPRLPVLDLGETYRWLSPNTDWYELVYASLELVTTWEYRQNFAIT